MSRGKLLEWEVAGGLTLLLASLTVIPPLPLAADGHCVLHHAWGRWAQTLGMNHVGEWCRGGHET